MVKGKTKSGIQFQLDERIKDDTRFLFFLTMMKSDNIDVVEKGKHVINMLKLIFGTEEGVLQFMDAVAAVNDGVCDTTTMLSELTDMFDALDAKNLSSSQS